MSKFYFTGDIRHPGKVVVEAGTLLQAEEKIESGEFTIFDEQDSCLAFDHDGNEPEVEDA